MFKPKLLKLLYCLLAIVPNVAFGVQASNLYTASVPVASQQQSDRGQGFNDAFLRVLVKVSGQYDRIMESKNMASMLPAEPYVQTFSYRENPAYLLFLEKQKELEQLALETAEAESLKAEDNALIGQEESIQGNESSKDLDELQVEVPPLQYLLDVSFAPSLIQEKMTASGIAIWGRTRPSTLIWVAIENEGERYILGAGDSEGLVESFIEVGEERGVPIFLPVADLQDVNAVNVDDLWGLYADSVDLASERYQADAQVIMRTYQSGEAQWSGNWLIKLKQGIYNGAIYEVSFDVLVESLVSDLASVYASHYAVLKTTDYVSNSLDIEVSKIITFEDYINLQRYLNTLPPVSSAVLQWIGKGRAAYHLELRGPQEQFLEHVELGGKLKPDVNFGRQSGVFEQDRNNGYVISGYQNGLESSLSTLPQTIAKPFVWSVGR